MMFFRSWFTLATIVLVAVIGAILNVPSPGLEWETLVVPAAADYMEESMGKAVSNPFRPLKGLRVALTGATSGIGLGLTRRLVELGATIVAIGRSPSKLERLKKEFPRNVETVVADFSDFDSIANASQYMLDHYDHIDVLVNNAGIHTGFHGILGTEATRQGYDLSFGVNYMSHFLLTEKLIPLLKKSAHPKVVQVSSRFHYAVDGSDLRRTDDHVAPIASQKGGSPGFFVFRSQRQYGNSKLAQILHARAVRDRYPDIATVSACPTWVGTQIGSRNGTHGHSIFQRIAFPMDGFGLSSILHAILDTNSNQAPSHDDFYVNTDLDTSLMDLLPAWTHQTVPLRDALMGTTAFTYILLMQRFLTTRQVSRSSVQSYDKTLQQDLYEWTHKAVAAWL